MKKDKVRAATAFGGAVVAAAVFGSRFNPAPETSTGAWYAKQSKSPLNPPNFVFAPVWTALYLTMTVAALRVWRAPDSPARTAALRLWFAQVGVNGAWSPLFFGLRQPALAMADLVALLALQAMFIKQAKNVDRTAALLFTPYVTWVLFAGYLNAEIIRRNP